MTAQVLRVTSHVGRDLLQSAQLFRHEHVVVWEYVSNGLQYKDPGTKPTVVVKIDPKARKLRISDNGRGMLMEDLQHYFQMHAENLDRKQGKPGRGRFGTGKSAAFGIANSLTLTTVRGGKRSKVRLTRQDIEARPEGDEIPVKILENQIPTNAPNGTLVEIEEIVLKTLDIGSIIRYIERSIARWPDASVLVNNHECEFSEPDVAREAKFSTKGTDYEKLLGDTTLVIKVAKAPLDDEFRGISILANGVWHETTLAGCDHKPFSEYLFGDFDVPALENDTYSIPAFDMSRSMKLNPRNEIVADIIRFIGVNLEGIRKDLERQDRERRKNDDQKKLQKQASKIAELINSHFKDWSTKLKKTMAKAGVGKDLLSAKDREDSNPTGFVFGDELPGVIVEREPQPHEYPIGPDPKPKSLTPPVDADEISTENLAKPDTRSKSGRPAGGFTIDFKNNGPNEKRAKYSRETRTILINLDHPRVAMEAGNASAQSLADDPHFLRMAYEIALTEYAIVLAQELSTNEYYLDPQDALVELRQTIDDLSKKFASAWSLY